jgi:hypothetical protein
MQANYKKKVFVQKAQKLLKNIKKNILFKSKALFDIFPI